MLLRLRHEPFETYFKCVYITVKYIMGVIFEEPQIGEARMTAFHFLSDLFFSHFVCSVLKWDLYRNHKLAKVKWVWQLLLSLTSRFLCGKLPSLFHSFSSYFPVFYCTFFSPRPFSASVTGDFMSICVPDASPTVVLPTTIHLLRRIDVNLPTIVANLT